MPIDVFIFNKTHRGLFLENTPYQQNQQHSIKRKGHAMVGARSLSLFFHNSIFGCELPISTIQTACDFTKAKIIFLSKSVPAAINLNCLMFCFIFESHYKRKRVRRKSDFRPKIIFTVNAMHRNQLPPSLRLSLLLCLSAF